MRQFIVISHTATITPDFSLNDLPGSGGRMDILCRCVGASLLTSHALRNNVRVYLLLQDKISIRIESSETRYLHPDERCIAALIKKALEKIPEVVGQIEIESTPGIYVSKRDLKSLLNSVDPSGTFIHLNESGISSQTFVFPSEPVFILSDHKNFSPSELDILNEYTQTTINLGPVSLHADQSITIVHNLLDVQNV
ncbi:MAG: tRNA (pseudouridine(54)-N(1))-methyltransferase TrmY [Halobacteriales archaeon]